MLLFPLPAVVDLGRGEYTMPATRRAFLGSPVLLGLAAALGGARTARADAGAPAVPAGMPPGTVSDMRTLSFTIDQTAVCHCPLCMARVAEGLPRAHSVPLEGYGAPGSTNLPG